MMLLNRRGQSAQKDRMINIMTIDLEDWYQDVELKNWDHYEDRIVQNTNKLLSLLDETNANATFFVLGYNAERFPELIENINKNHEIATHGYDHTPLLKQTPTIFEKELTKSIKILERITKEKIIGYRAPIFSVVQETSWAIDILKKHVKYDSSIFPVKTPLYSNPKASRFPYRLSSLDTKMDGKGDFFEFPPATYRIPILRKNIPIAGGFYLRLFPYRWIKYSIERINKEKQPAVCYLHPWEIDPKQPKIKSYRWWHYYNLDKAEKRFRRLLRDFKFISIKEYLEYKQL